MTVIRRTGGNEAVPEDRPPLLETGPLGWLRRNLFNGWFNSLLTLALLWVLVQIVPPLLDWLVFEAVGLDATPAVCRQAEGACWGFVGEWYRFILFGYYPLDEHWRPVIAVALLLGLLVATARPGRGRIALILPAAVTLAVMAAMLLGGLAGLARAAGGTAEDMEAVAAALGLLFAALLGLVLIRSLRRPDRRGLWLIATWAGSFLVIGVLMGGGLFGLTLVETTRWGGLPLTLGLSVVGLGAAFPLGILLALGRRSSMPAVRMLCIAYIELIRGVPLITILFMASFLFPLFMPPGVTIDALLRAQLGMIVFAAAYLAEVVRGGLQAIPRGQYEAADSLGLSYWQKTALIILPQALRISIPPLVNTFIAFLKDTSLVAIIGLVELVGATKAALSNPLWRGFYPEAYLFIGLIFWLLCFSMSRYSQGLERQLNRDSRR